MIELLAYAIFTGIAIAGIAQATHEGMILEWLYNLSLHHLPWWMHMPLIGCVTCMGSVWGGTSYLLVYQDIKLLPLFVGSVAAIGTITYTQMNK